jgi:hypothetical protein
VGVLCYDDLHGNGHCERICQPCCSVNRKDVRPRFISVRNVPNNFAMDGARDAVLQLEVHLGNCVFWEH